MLEGQIPLEGSDALPTLSKNGLEQPFAGKPLGPVETFDNGKTNDEQAHTANVQQDDVAVDEKTREWVAEDYSISLPDHITEEFRDDAMLGRFKNFCVQTGLSPEQAQKAVDFYMAEQDGEIAGQLEQCESYLRSTWREKFNERITKAQQACAVFDKRMNGRLMPLISSGLGNHPIFAEFMAEVGMVMGEDSFASGNVGSVNNEAMSTEEFLRKVVFKNK